MSVLYLSILSFIHFNCVQLRLLYLIIFILYILIDCVAFYHIRNKYEYFRGLMLTLKEKLEEEWKNKEIERNIQINDTLFHALIYFMNICTIPGLPILFELDDYYR